MTSIQEISNFLKTNSKIGRLLSQEYKNAKAKLLWECKKGHQWEASWDNIKKGSWCPICVKLAKPSLETLQKFAVNKRGKLLSACYTNNKVKLDWECEKGHCWKASWNSISHMNSWCPVCAKLAKPTIQSLREYASNNKGKLLTAQYKNNRQKLVWECEKGHQWEASAHCVVYQKHWCHTCAVFKSERESLSLAAKIFNFSFTKKRIIYNDVKLEFDGFNEEHKIAIEYQGYQHYIFPNYFHTSKEEFYSQQNRDLLKREYCKLNGIYLIEIPFNCGSLSDFIKTAYEQYLRHFR